MPSKRFVELDLWRGFAVTGMIIFHAAFILNFFGFETIPVREGLWHGLARSVQWSFLLLVGISLAISNKPLLHQWGRSVKVFLCGMVVTFVTYLAIPGQHVRFGILHLIGFSILLLSPLAARPKLALTASVIIGILSLLFPLEFRGASIDYFPPLPWTAVPALGIFFGHFLYPKNERRYEIPSLDAVARSLTPMLWLGKHALIIYLIHVPLLTLIFFGLYSVVR